MLRDINLIHSFDFYLTVTFLLSMGLRIRQYHALIGLVRAMPGRWPKLMQLVRQHHGIFVTPATLGPLALTLVLWGVQIVASRWLWPDAGRPPYGLTVGRLGEHLALVPAVAFLGMAMLGLDGYFMFWISKVDRSETEKYFDQAEYWLKSWSAPVVHIFTLGFINPRRMVKAEVRRALEEASCTLNTTLWWMCLQTGLRIAYGLALWGTYAWSQA